MRGYVFTITTFLIFLGIIMYFNAFADATRARDALIGEQIAGERIFHSWRSVASGLTVMANVSMLKMSDIDEINDTLPAAKNTGELMDRWQSFVRLYYNDSSMNARFEDDAGNEVSLKDTASKIVIMPMGINYTWPDWAKKECSIRASSAAFPFIERLSIKIMVSPWMSDPNIDWNPKQTCIGGPDCLNFTLDIYDNNNHSWSDFSMLDVTQESRVKVGLSNDSANYWVRVQVGKIPTVINIDMQNANASVNTRLDLNTTEFYNSFLAKLRVSTPFGQKVAPVSGMSVWTDQR